MKITNEMVEYWLGIDWNLSEIVEDYRDIANGEYDSKMLSRDIVSTWEEKEESQ
jgi:hypothetical protein|tara:strand:+ start:582 stop:743 length:162 start_codon:yes stop_codon:yes gene_type:complete